MAADGAAAVEILRAELARAKDQSQRSNAAAEKASAKLKAEQAARCQDEEKISTMTLELENATSRCEFLDTESEALTAHLEKALQEARGARSECRAAHEEVRQVREIAAGKPFLLQTKFGDPNYAKLNQVWSSPDEFLDLPKSSADAVQYYQVLLLNEQMSQWAELHRISGAAMKDVIIRLWQLSLFQIATSVSYKDLLKRCRVSTL